MLVRIGPESCFISWRKLMVFFSVWLTWLEQNTNSVWLSVYGGFNVSLVFKTFALILCFCPVHVLLGLVWDSISYLIKDFALPMCVYHMHSSGMSLRVVWVHRELSPFQDSYSPLEPILVWLKRQGFHRCFSCCFHYSAVQLPQSRAKVCF